MFKDDSDSDDGGILSKAYAKIAEKTEKGIDPDASYASESDINAQDSTLDSALFHASLLDTSDRPAERIEPVIAVDSASLRRSPERIEPEIVVDSAPLRRSPRIKNAPLNVSIDNDVDFITSKRRRSARRVVPPEHSSENPSTQKRNTRTTRGRKRKNPNVICIGSDDEDSYSSFAISSKSNEKAIAGSKAVKFNSKQNDVILLGSDDETPSKNDHLKEIMNVKIEWMCEGGLIIPHGRAEPFSKIYEELSRTKGYDVNKIVLSTRDGKIVKHHETPLSIKLSVIDILEGSISSKAIENEDSHSTQDADSEINNENLLNFKILVEGQKAPSFVKIEKDQTMHVLLTKLAGKLNCSVDRMRLWFDGEIVSLQDTPTDLDLEGDECFELKFKKK